MNAEDEHSIDGALQLRSCIPALLPVFCRAGIVVVHVSLWQAICTCVSPGQVGELGNVQFEWMWKGH